VRVAAELVALGFVPFVTTQRKASPFIPDATLAKARVTLVVPE
jgi:hypothetical protein